MNQKELRQALPGLTARAANTLDAAAVAAKRLGHPVVDQGHLLLGICAVRETLGAKMLVDLGVDLSDLEAQLASTLAPRGDEAAETDEYSESVVAALVDGRAKARELGHSWIGVEHFVLGLLATPGGAGHDALVNRGVTVERALGSCDRLLPAHVTALRFGSS